MIVQTVEISFLIFDSYSLKDKRSVVKSILKKLHNRHNVSTAELGSLDVLNEAVIGLATIGNSQKICEQVLRQCIQEIEDNYPVEIHTVDWDRY